MKKAIFIGNRLNVISQLKAFKELTLIKVYVLEGSLLHKKLQELELPEDLEVTLFKIGDKAKLIEEIKAADFDILISNGCPIILPVSKIKKEGQIFINVHPTVLPDLKGKTPLNGVFMTHRRYIGATMHYIDDGIDTGSIVAQEKAEVTDDLDQGLVYKISFDLERPAFKKGMDRIIEADYDYPGSKQEGEGSYFNRTDELQTIDFRKDDTDMIIDKVKSFGIKGQGSHMVLEGVAYRIYSAEKIVNGYLLATYSSVGAGKLVFEYDDKFVVRTIDGMVKLTDFEVLA